MIIHRDWPPPADETKPTHPIMIEVQLGFLLFILAPLGAWFVAALPGVHPWAPTIWPAGWSLAAMVLLGGNLLRERRSRR